MNAKTPSHHGHRFPPAIIRHAVWLYYRFCLSFRDVEDLLAERGVIVSCETIRQWSRKFGAEYARKLKRRERRLGDTWHLHEPFVTIQGKRQSLWRAVPRTEQEASKITGLGILDHQRFEFPASALTRQL
jgi:putative transposase